MKDPYKHIVNSYYLLFFLGKKVGKKPVAINHGVIATVYPLSGSTTVLPNYYSLSS